MKRDSEATKDISQSQPVMLNHAKLKEKKKTKKKKENFQLKRVRSEAFQKKGNESMSI